MSTVVQRSYRPQQAPAVAGMIADMTGSEVGTRQCETAAGIGFGLAVSQGSKDKGCVLGGSAFIGISVRDITLNQISIDPLNSGAALAADVYSQYINMAVLSRGHIWVMANALVLPNDPLYYDTTYGTFGGVGGEMASGYIDFTAQPKPGDTVTLGSAGVITFEASGASGDQANIGPTLGDTIEALANFINTVSNAAINTVTALYPPSPGGAGEGSGANTLMIGAVTVGVGAGGSPNTGDSITLATNVPGATVSGSTLTGGTASATGARPDPRCHPPASAWNPIRSATSGSRGSCSSRVVKLRISTRQMRK